MTFGILRFAENNIDRDGLGVERFYVPGRNSAASIEICF
ncbi:hypothetical protein CF65_00464 [Aggregatibacter actinomycetemcomitans HK1651]|nr:hypothetical protein CF65_00464 [Aggregatibacter actinomycetemcomitans HK1651]